MAAPLEAGLYIVSTPIGAPQDLSPRAAQCLAEVDLIAAEDTRIARTTLKRLGISQRLLSFHDHNEEARVPELVEQLKAGASIALISDQGTPLISDPGYRLVAAAASEGIAIHAVPGPSAILAALVLSGLPCDRFLALGFLPRRANRRRESIEALRSEAATLVLFEAKQRLLAALRDLADILGPRRAALARNLTKRTQTVQRGSLTELVEQIEAEQTVRGEFTIVVEGSRDPQAIDATAIERLIDRLLEAGLPKRTIRDIVAETFSLTKADAYRQVLAR